MVAFLSDFNFKEVAEDNKAFPDAVTLTHCGLYDNTNLDQHLVRQRLFAWQHQTTPLSIVG